MAGTPTALALGRSGRRRGVAGRDGVLLHDLEVDGEHPLGARLEVLQDRRQEVVLEPLLVIAVRRPEADSPFVDADALDGAQPEIAVRGFHQRFDGPDRFRPELKHRSHLSTATVPAKMISDFRRDHATSPCLSTTLGNRKLPDDERLAVGLWVFLFRSSQCHACGSRAVDWFSINRCQRQQARCGASVCKVAKIGADNFFTFVTQAMHGINPDRGDRA